MAQECARVKDTEGDFELTHVEELNRERKGSKLRGSQNLVKMLSRSLAELYACGRRLIFWFKVSPSQNCKWFSSSIAHSALTHRVQIRFLSFAFGSCGWKQSRGVLVQNYFVLIIWRTWLGSTAPLLTKLGACSYYYFSLTNVVWISKVF